MTDKRLLSKWKKKTRISQLHLFVKKPRSLTKGKSFIIHAKTYGSVLFLQ